MVCRIFRPPPNSSSKSYLDMATADDPDLDRVEKLLRLEVIWLHQKWQEYRRLFAGPEGRISVLNRAAPSFFRTIQDVMWDDILLHIARLTDSAATMRHADKRNLTLQCLPAMFSDAKLADELQGLVNDSVAKAGFAWKWRTKRLAHTDLAVALGRAATRLPGVSRADIEQVLKSFRKLLDHVQGVRAGCTTAYEHISTTGDADDLVSHLQTSLKARDQRRQRISEGNYQPGDLFDLDDF